VKGIQQSVAAPGERTWRHKTGEILFSHDVYIMHRIDVPRFAQQPIVKL